MWDQGVMGAMGRLYADSFMDGPRQHGGCRCEGSLLV